MRLSTLEGQFKTRFLVAVTALMLLVGVTVQAAPYPSYGWGYMYFNTPTAGQAFDRGTSVSISWGYTYTPGWIGSSQTLEYTSNGGSTWNTIVSGLDGYANSYTWTIPSTVTPSSNFYLRVYEVPYAYYGWYNAATTPGQVGPFTVNKGCFAPKITTQPTNQSVCIGGSVTFTVVSDMTSGTYEWMKDGNVIATTKSNVFSISNVQTSSAGTYSVKLTDDCSVKATATSAGGILTVWSPPAITTQPATTVSLCQNADYTMSVAATGQGLIYQWYKDGNIIAGATASTYTVINAQSTHSGTYRCQITGTCAPSVSTTNLVLSVLTRPAITLNPQSTTLCPGETKSISVAATGSQLTYQWYKDDAIILGATTSTYQFTNYNTSMDGVYSCEVKSGVPNPNNCPLTVYTTPALIKGYSAPKLVKSPVNTEVCTGKALSLVSEFTGPNLNYTWTRNGVVIPNQNSNELTVPAVTAANAGTYVVTAYSTCNLSIATTPATVTVVNPPMFTSQPTPVSVAVGARIQLMAAATGASSFQWFKDNQPIAGATSATYTVDVATRNDAGYYRVTASNACTGIVSVSVRVSVLDPQVAEPQLTLTSMSKDMGEVPRGYSVSSTLTGLITNTGTAELDITGITSSSMDFVVVSPTTFSVLLAPGMSTNVELRAEGMTLGDKTANLTIMSNSNPSSVAVELTSKVVLRYDVPDSYNFADTREDSTREACFAISNNSQVPVSIEDIEVTGLDAASFSIVTARPLALAVGETKDLCVRFIPGSEGDKSATLMYTSPTGGNTSMALTGKGTLIVGVNEEALASEVSVYPNPATNVVTVKAVSGASVTIVNAQGAKVASFSIANDANEYVWNTRGTNSVPSGSYTVIVKKDGKTANIPLVIVK